jgi:hypothetical protein
MARPVLKLWNNKIMYIPKSFISCALHQVVFELSCQKKMRWASHVARMGRLYMRTSIYSGNLKGRDSFGVDALAGRIINMVPK